MKPVPILLVLLAIAALAVWWFRASGPAAPTAGPDSARGVESEAPADGATVRTITLDDGAGSAQRTQVAEQQIARSVKGQVFGPDDRPVAGADVVLFEVLSPWPSQRLRQIDAGLSDNDGRFGFEAMPEVDLMVQVERAGMARERMLVPPAVEHLTVRLAHGFEIHGFVRDARNQLVADCDVYLEPGAWGGFRAEHTRTDATGQFRFVNVPAGLARVTARSDYYRAVTAPMVTVGSGIRIGLEFLHPSMPTMGRVVEAAAGHRPVSGAEVRVLPGTWNGGLYVPTVASTDAQGRFKLLGLGDGNLRFEVHHPDYSIATRGVTVRDGVDELVFEVVGRSRVAGRLEGAGVAGLQLQLDTADGERSRTTVAADGSFEFPHSFSAGLGELEILDGQRAFAASSSRLLEVTIEEAPTSEFELEVVAPSIVRARVVSAGEPVRDVQVSTPRSMRRTFERFVAVTDSAGTFELRGLPPGGATLTLESDAFAIAMQDIVVPAAGEVLDVGTIELLDAGRLDGLVLRGGEPLPGAIVFASQTRRNVTTVSGPDGRYVLRGLAPGMYRVKARYSTLPLESVADSIEVVAGAKSEIPDFVFPVGRRVRGSVQEADAPRAVADALVFVPGTIGAAIYTDANGKFEIEVRDDTRELQVYAPDFSMHVAVELDADAGEHEIFVALPIAPRAQVRARVLGLPDLKPLASGVVRVKSLSRDTPTEATHRRQTSVEGKRIDMSGGLLVIDWVPAGRSTFTLQCQGFAPFVTDVDLEPREVFDLGTLELEPGAELHGRVVDADRRAVVGAGVYLGEEADGFRGGFRAQTLTDTDGRFVVRGVSAQSRRLVVSSNGFATAVVDARIPADLLRRADDPLEVVLRKASTITVQVLDAAGAPTDGLLVVMRKGGVPIGQRYPSAQGQATFQTFGPGDYEVELFGENVSVMVPIGAEPAQHAVELRSKR